MSDERTLELPSRPALGEVAVDAVLTAGRARAAELGGNVTIVIVDETLFARAMLRMDGADTLTVGLASGKARLAAANGMPTTRWRGIMDADAFLGPTIPTALDRILDGAVLFGGGHPIRVRGHTIGAVGVSGGTEADDEEIARSSLTALPQAQQPRDANGGAA